MGDFHSPRLSDQPCPAHVVQWSNHLGAMCSRAWRSQWPRIDSSLGPGESAYYKRIISNNSYAHDDQGDNPGQENSGLDGVLYKLWPFVSDIAIFVLKRDVKLQLTNSYIVRLNIRKCCVALVVLTWGTRSTNIHVEVSKLLSRVLLDPADVGL